jgi:hypothetical protein
MSVALTWNFVDGDTSGDGASWLNHQSQLWGFIDVHDARDGSTRRIMTVTDAWVREQLDSLRREGKASVFAAMIVVPAGPPIEVRAAIDVAVATGAADFGLLRAADGT